MSLFTFQSNLGIISVLPKSKPSLGQVFLPNLSILFTSSDHVVTKRPHIDFIFEAQYLLLYYFVLRIIC